jgi:tetratricopeptide (TPR) repeat protein
MSKLDPYSERIADYLYNEMAPDERSAFETELKTNPGLATAFKRQSELVDYLITKTRLDEIENSPDMAEAERLVAEYLNPDGNKQGIVPKRNQIIRILLPVAAAAAIFIGVILIHNFGQDNIGNRLYSSYYKPLNEVSFNTRGEGNDLYREFRMALDSYLKEEYNKSTRMLSSLLARSPEFPEAQLYLGLSFMGQEEFPSSIRTFESLIEKSDAYSYEAKWYLALCYLKTEDFASAKNLLNELADLDGTMGEQSTKILKRLDRMK